MAQIDRQVKANIDRLERRMMRGIKRVQRLPERGGLNEWVILEQEDGGEVSYVWESNAWRSLGNPNAIEAQEAERISEEAVANAPQPAQVRASREFRVAPGVEQQEILTYTIGNPPRERFVVDWYEGMDNYINRVAMDDPPATSFLPSTPAQTPGDHDVVMTYTVPAALRNRGVVLYRRFYLE